MGISLTNTVDSGRRAVLRAVSGNLPDRGPRKTRHVWETDGRAHVELRGVHDPDQHALRQKLEHSLHAIEGVHWAEINPVLARVVIAFDPERVSLDDIVDTIEDVEDEHDVDEGDALPDRPEHPADPERLHYATVEIAADVAGVFLGAVGRALRLPRLPVDLAAVLPAIDTLPPVRRRFDRNRALEAAFLSTSALVQGFTQGPTGLAIDAGHRVMVMREASARLAAWQRLEALVHSERASATPAPFERRPRPVALPDGAIERYATGIALTSLGAGAAVFAFTRRPRATANVILAAVPRSARLGREGFSTQTSVVFASRDIVTMDPRVVRRLDRIDTVVVDAAVLGARREAVDALVQAVRDAAQDLVIAGDVSGLDGIEPDLVVAGGDQLDESVRALQGEGRIVAIVTDASGAALHDADCGIGIVADPSAPPWGAHVLCPNLHAAAVVIDATAVARDAARHSVAVSLTGTGVASAFALSPAPGASTRVVLASNAASMVAMGVGIWDGLRVGQRPLPPPERVEIPWHSLPAGDVTAQLGSGPEGLTQEQAAERREASESQASASFGSLLVRELANPLTAVLAAGGVLSTVAGSITDGLLITGVLGLNAVVGATQRQRTEQAIRHLTSSVSNRAARVRRDGTIRHVPLSELVDGDVVLLHAGDVVPGDVRLLATHGLELDESALTGESLPVVKQLDPVAADLAVADRASMAYGGTAVASGRGEGVVVATGSRTEARRGIDEGARPPDTGVEARLEQLTRRTVPIVLAAGGVLTASSLVRGIPAREAVSTGVSLAAAAIPEGLPFLATVAQSGAARRLSKEGVLVRNPRVLEALGRVDVLCFDKTGTLTEGQLHVRSLSDGDAVEAMPTLTDRGRAVLTAAARATPRKRSEKLPHPTDQAIVDAADALELELDDDVSGWDKVTSLPFEPSRGYHAVLGDGDGGRVLSVKGAPEVVLPRCDTWLRRGKVVELDDGLRRRLDRHVDRLARQGLRVLAVAERETSGRDHLDDDRVDRLELRGFVTVADVPRASAIEPIAKLQRAGIAVVMLTGDHPVTAQSIASELGLQEGGVVSGPEVDLMSDDELDRVVEHATVFARVTPAHKVRIVQAFQRAGRVVAMTGDGANDAQAIRLAEIGIAFGPRATPAARAAADLVVIEDSVETLVTAIVEGRAMWASVRDALALLLGGNLGETIFATGAGLLTGRSPLNARQLLAVNMLTDLAPAMAIALQPPLQRHIDLGREGPETSLGGALARDIAVRAAATSAGAMGAWTVARFTGTRSHADTVAFAALVGSQLGQTIVVGRRSPMVLAAGLVSVGALVGIVQTPGVSQFFGCRPLGPFGWSVAAGASVAATGGAVVLGRLLDRAPGLVPARLALPAAPVEPHKDSLPHIPAVEPAPLSS